MKKIFLFIVLTFLTIIVYSNDFKDININNIDEQWNNQFFSAIINQKMSFKFINLRDVYVLGDSLLKNNKIKDQKPNETYLFVDNKVLEDKSNYGDLLKSFVYNKSLSIDVYIKKISLENEKQVICISYLLNKDNTKRLLFTNWNFSDEDSVVYDILDIILSEKKDKLVVLYQNVTGSFELINIDLNNKICYSINVPPTNNSFNSGARRFSLARIWNNNIVRYDFEDTTEYYKIYQTKDDILSNYDLLKIDKPNYENNNILYESPRLVYSAKDTDELKKSYDYNKVDIDFNLDGWYYININEKPTVNAPGRVLQKSSR